MARVGAQSPTSLTVTGTQAQLLFPEGFVRTEVAGSCNLARPPKKSMIRCEPSLLEQRINPT